MVVCQREGIGRYLIPVRGLISMDSPEVSKVEIEESIKFLLTLAYDELKKAKPTYSGYPVSDLILCFLDSKDEIGDDRFYKIYNEVVPDTYKNNWDKFQVDKIESKLDPLLEDLSKLDSISALGDSERIMFDAFSEKGVICNVGLASALLFVYSFKKDEQSWIEERKDQLIKSTKLLINNKIDGGWRYFEREKDPIHTLPTWLSILTLSYVPEIIGNEIKGGWTDERENIKNNVRDWLIRHVHRRDNYCSWSWNPGEKSEDLTNPVNPVATAQAILALYHIVGVADMDEEIKEIIASAIEYIKANKSNMSDQGDIYKREKLSSTVARISENFHPGVQHCLQALLSFNVPHRDEIMQDLLKETVKIIPRFEKDENDLSVCYATLWPLLLYYQLSTPKILLDTSASMREFESFVSKAEESIMLIGEIDYRYAELIPKKKVRIRVFCRPAQEKALFKEYQKKALLNEYQKNYSWEYELIGKDKTYASEIINCVIVDGKKALLSREPFKDLDRDNFYKYIEDDEVSDLIGQIEKISGIEIPIRSGDIKQEILNKLSEFPMHTKIIKPELENMSPDELTGIFEYVNLTPEYAEGAKLTSALGLNDRETVERKLSERGVFSRVFVNSELKNLMEKSMAIDNIDYPLILDESSAYVILNYSGDKKAIIEKCLTGIVTLHVTFDIYDKITKQCDASQRGRFEKIDKEKCDSDKYINTFNKQELPNYHFTSNEQIEIGFLISEGWDKKGIITNSWEVARVCKENNVRTFSLMKFLDKDENMYKIFRIPVDELPGDKDAN
jgi:hypothetical protein